jgi:hypothetical protein
MSNILVITQRFPYPTDRGDKVRVFNISRQLSKNNNVYLLVLEDIEKIDAKALNKAKEIYKEIWGVRKSGIFQIIDMFISLFSDRPLQIAKFHSNVLNEKAINIVSELKIDIVYGFHVRSLDCLLNIKRKFPKIKVICDLTDCMGLYISRMQKNTKSIPLKYLLLLERKRIEEYETKYIDIIDEFWLVSEQDFKYHPIWINNREKFKIIPNGVDENLSW